MRRLAEVFLFAASTFGCNSTLADTLLYGINCCGQTTTSYVYQIDATTGAITKTYTNLGSNGGTGLAVVGDTMYYTTDNSNEVYSYNLATKTDQGALFRIPNSIIGTPWALASDGTNLYVADQTRSAGNVFKFSVTGQLLQSLTLSKCSFCDGLTYFSKDGAGYLIANEETLGGPDDLYNLDGSLEQADFLDAGQTYFTAGIAYDGTDFYTSNLNLGSLDEWSGTGAYLKTITLTGAPDGYPPSIIGLSADVSREVTPPPTEVPEPATWLLLAIGAAGLLHARSLGARGSSHAEMGQRIVTSIGKV